MASSCISCRRLCSKHKLAFNNEWGQWIAVFTVRNCFHGIFLYFLVCFFFFTCFLTFSNDSMHSLARLILLLTLTCAVKHFIIFNYLYHFYLFILTLIYTFLGDYRFSSICVLFWILLIVWLYWFIWLLLLLLLFVKQIISVLVKSKSEILHYAWQDNVFAWLQSQLPCSLECMGVTPLTNALQLPPTH